MNAYGPHPRIRQRGIVSVMAAIILFAAVIFVLQQTYGILGTTGSSNDAQSNSIAAFFLAESGLERGQGLLRSAADPTAKSACDGVATPLGSDIPLGRGTFSLSTTSTPTGCTTACTGCTITSTGKVAPSSQRVLERVITISSGSGSVQGSGGANSTNACTDSPIQTPLTNPVNAPAVVLTSFGYRQHVTPGGPLSSRNCTPPTQVVTLNSQNFHSNNPTLVGIRANIYDVAPLGTIPKLLQGLTSSSNYSLVSVIFPGISGAPTKLDTYWNDVKIRTSNTGTEQEGSITGSTNSGVASSTGTCDTPASLGITETIPPSYHGDKQSCNKWCYGGDTLVFLLAHGGTSTSSQVPPGGVRFNTGGTPAQNIQMTRQVHQGVSAATSYYLYSEIWYAYNPDYLSNSLAATSGGVVTAKAGVPSSAFSATLTSGVTDMNVTANGGNNIYVGDTVYCPSTGAGCTNGQLVGTISGVPGGGNSSSATGAYTLSSGSTVTVTTRALTVKSGVLQVSAFSNGWISKDDTLTGSSTATITSVPSSGCSGSTLTCQATGDYGISPQDSFVSSSNNITASGYTIHTTGGTIPTASPVGVPIATTLLAVRAGTGALAARSCVLANPAPTATLFFLGNLDDAGNCSGTNPVVNANRLVNATVCGGTCAFFNDPSSTTSTTAFTVDTGNATENANTHWAGGFTCLSGVDPGNIRTGSGSSVNATGWHEVVR